MSIELLTCWWWGWNEATASKNVLNQAKVPLPDKSTFLSITYYWCCWCANAADALMLLNQDQDQLADLSIAFCSSFFFFSGLFIKWGWQKRQVPRLTWKWDSRMQPSKGAFASAPICYLCCGCAYILMLLPFKYHHASTSKGIHTPCSHQIQIQIQNQTFLREKREESISQ